MDVDKDSYPHAWVLSLNAAGGSGSIVAHTHRLQLCCCAGCSRHSHLEFVGQSRCPQSAVGPEWFWFCFKNFLCVLPTQGLLELAGCPEDQRQSQWSFYFLKVKGQAVMSAHRSLLTYASLLMCPALAPEDLIEQASGWQRSLLQQMQGTEAKDCSQVLSRCTLF